MIAHSIKILAVCALAILPLGCEPAPVVVNPGADGTTVIEEREVEVVPKDSTMPPPGSDTDVKVDIGGGKGVEVDVDRDGAENSKPNP